MYIFCYPNSKLYVFTIGNIKYLWFGYSDVYMKTKVFEEVTISSSKQSYKNFTERPLEFISKVTGNAHRVDLVSY